MNIHKAHAFKNSSDEYLSGKDTWIQIVDFNCDIGHSEFSGKTMDSYGSFTEDDSGNFHCNAVAGIAAANFANGSDSTDIMV